jgi:hypothetical protein
MPQKQRKRTASEEKAFVDKHQAAARAAYKAPKRPSGVRATTKQLAARKKVVAADVKAAAAKNAAGRAAATRKKYTPPGLQSLVDVFSKKKKEQK